MNRRALAFILGFGSYLTTLWFVEFVWPEGRPPDTYILALILEIVLLSLKRQVIDSSFRRGDVAGWTAIVLDTLINAAGLLPRAERLILFPPIDLLTSLVGLNLDTPLSTSPYTVGGVAMSLLLGFVLSYLPIRLWGDS